MTGLNVSEEQIDLSKVSSNGADPSRSKLYERVAISQDFLDETEVKQILTSVPIRKPIKDEFIKVHPENNLTLSTLELKTESGVWVVDRDIVPHVKEEVVVKVLVHTINSAGVSFLWPLKYSGNDGRSLDNWSLTAINASQVAKNKWIRLKPDHIAGGYSAYEAQGNLPEPEWPEESWEDVMDIAFRDRIIDSVDHHIIRKLKGLQF